MRNWTRTALVFRRMFEAQPHEMLRQIIRDFENLAQKFEQALETFVGEGDNPKSMALKRARQAARRGAEIVRDALSEDPSKP